MTTRLSQEQRLRLAKETEWRQNYAHYGVHPGNLGFNVTGPAPGWQLNPTWQFGPHRQDYAEQINAEYAKAYADHKRLGAEARKYFAGKGGSARGWQQRGMAWRAYGKQSVKDAKQIRQKHH